MLKEIPRWALERACAAIGRKVNHFDRMGEDNILRQSIAAHAFLIAKHEKPPAGKLIGKLHWETADGTVLELKQVSRHEFCSYNVITGIPTVFAVWPEPEMEAV